MKRKLYQDDFEAFLSEMTEEHRMYPSDRVWRNVQDRLHGKTPWPALTFGAILTGAIILAGLILVQPQKELFNATSNNVSKFATSEIDKQIGRNTAPTNGNRQPESTDFAMEMAPTLGMTSAKSVQKPSHYPVVSQNSESNQPRPNAHQISDEGLEGYEQAPDVTAKIPAQIVPEAVASVGEPGVVQEIRVVDASINFGDDFHENNPLDQLNGSFIAASEIGVPKNTYSLSSKRSALDLSFNQKVLGYNEAFDEVDFARSGKKSSKWGLQFYATPSLSNRVLLEDKILDSHIPINGPVAPNVINGVNSFARHRAKIGVAIGSSLLYAVTDNLSLKAGLQVSFRQYAIEGFNISREPAMLRLVDGNGVDTINTFATVGNVLGRYPVIMNNQYLQVGIPIGFDVKMTEWNKVQLFVSATVQPTYQVAQRALLITNDYSKYVEQDDLLRKWNINSGIEAFLQFKGAGLNWQVGPQIRYQMLPGTQSAYPIKEHLIDYGMKIGVVKQLF